ncbi:polyketide synthase [Talaromyces pinophilus]|uniref:Polyketide synthase n=1 Tax=Talaromyces pinophilus TaxID=128442 RepID=A0A6V8H333_TALPI|nr:polyketide synthase [Talaromyces pinophilus]
MDINLLLVRCASDSVFENIDHDAWSASLRPKVDGSWNLHQQLPRDLDFFILFSSIAGAIGSQGQANYAAGNTFQDGSTKYRLSRGEKAISLNMSMIADRGYGLENEEVARRFAKSRFVLEMTQAEVLALLEHTAISADHLIRHTHSSLLVWSSRKTSKTETRT